MPLDTDNDLLLINDNRKTVAGEPTYLSGQILSKSGLPVRNAFVEIWQTDAYGNYIHSSGAISTSPRDAGFQGYGRFLTDSAGRYYFRTIKPVPYTQDGIYRTPHIHLAVSQHGRRIFTTQLVINGHPDNATDILFRRIRDPLARETLMVDFKPMHDSKYGELEAVFDIHLGVTVEEMDDGSLRGLGKPLGMTGLQPPQWGD
jgi:protocatechuate 3,4-dioxygenase beta subunit